MSDTEKSCKHCIHNDVCQAKITYYEIVEKWNLDFSYLQFSPNSEETLAKDCGHYKTLSNLFIKKQHATKMVPSFEPSPALKKILERLDQIEEISSSDELSQEEDKELEEIYSRINHMTKYLNKQEWDFVEKYTSEIPGCKIE